MENLQMPLLQVRMANYKWLQTLFSIYIWQIKKSSVTEIVKWTEIETESALQNIGIPGPKQLR